MNNRTFAIIKPDAIKNNYMGKIIDHILKENFNILSAKLLTMSKITAEEFYSIHKERPFFENLCEYMCSGPIIVMSLKKENAVEDFRRLIGSTDRGTGQ